jgi:hypothetical protein
MAEPEDPFETEELKLKRTEQRRMLRMVESWIVHNVAERSPLPRLGVVEPGHGLDELEFQPGDQVFER